MLFQRPRLRNKNNEKITKWLLMKETFLEISLLKGMRNFLYFTKRSKSNSQL